MPDLLATYVKVDTEGTFRQGEILSDLQQYFVIPDRDNALPKVTRRDHPFAVILSQDCDLIQDFNARRDNKLSSFLPSVLLCQVDMAEQLRSQGTMGSDIWKRVKQNKDERFQYLRAFGISEDCEEQGCSGALAIDFKKYFTVETESLLQQRFLGLRRRCMLTSPYLEHLSSRFAHFISRVALPKNHHDE